MSYQEKRIITTMISSLLVLAVYCIYSIKKYVELGADLQNDLIFWSMTMLIFIGITIVAIIVILIIFHILLSISAEVKKELDKNQVVHEIEDVEDEMDRLISLKAMKTSYIIVGIGFVVALLSASLGSPVAVMLNIIYISFMLASVLGGVSQLYYYRKGVLHG